MGESLPLPYSKLIKMFTILDLILSILTLALYTTLWTGYTISISNYTLEGDPTIFIVGNDHKTVLRSILAFAILVSSILINLLELATTIFLMHQIKNNSNPMDIIECAISWRKISLSFATFIIVAIVIGGKAGKSYITFGILGIRGIFIIFISKFIKELEYIVAESSKTLAGVTIQENAARKMNYSVPNLVAELQMQQLHAKSMSHLPLGRNKLPTPIKPPAPPPPPPVPPRIGRHHPVLHHDNQSQQGLALEWGKSLDRIHTAI